MLLSKKKQAKRSYKLVELGETRLELNAILRVLKQLLLMLVVVVVGSVVLFVGLSYFCCCW